MQLESFSKLLTWGPSFEILTVLCWNTYCHGHAQVLIDCKPAAGCHHWNWGGLERKLGREDNLYKMEGQKLTVFGCIMITLSCAQAFPDIYRGLPCPCSILQHRAYSQHLQAQKSILGGSPEMGVFGSAAQVPAHIRHWHFVCDESTIWIKNYTFDSTRHEND